ncbi:N-acyl homoserine lactonase AiiB [mine drainage metagenome]|uniref:N-acyl homoserine lactonase AiiB n=1 Tax=mine drainage metagenome TaxID=410659 RepID=A0A1J5PK99_9ZZZZ
MTVTPLGDDVFQIDTEQSGYAGITAGYLIRSSKPCLVETGTASSAETVIAALREVGIGPDHLATIVVTHVHLDHAGGAGHLTSYFPKAQLIAHERGARHLVDPSRLMASARRVFGRLLDDVMGELLPTPIERVISLGDVGKIDLGDGRSLDTFYAPGHASHHIGLVDSSSGDLYVGDAAGVYIQETKTQRPATPPPDFDLEITLKSIELFRSLAPNRLLFSHYGPVTEIEETLDGSIEELRLWVELVRNARTEQLDLDHAIAMIKEKTHERYARLIADPALTHRFEELNSTGANIVGINRWLDKIENDEYSFGDAAH